VDEGAEGGSEIYSTLMLLVFDLLFVMADSCAFTVRQGPSPLLSTNTGLYASVVVSFSHAPPSRLLLPMGLA
jgi:hypothetical protein